MDLCGAMRVETVNGKRYILVIVDGYSRYTQVYFPRTKDKTLKMVIKFITQIQRNMKVQVLKVRSDNETEFRNEKPRSYYEKLGIMHQTSIARMPQHNGVVECRNRTLIEEYYATRTPEAQIIPLQNTLDNEDTSSSSSIIVEDHDAPQIVSLSEEPIVNKPTTLDFDNHSDEQVQEDVAELDGNTSMNPFVTLKWTMNHPIKQVIGNPSKPVTIRSRLYTDAEMCMYSLTVSTTEPTNIKEAMLDQSWIESMQDELNQFKRLDVWELVERPTDRNVIKAKWLWKNKTDAKNTEAARQLLEQAPCSPEYVPDPMELEDHVPVYIPEPEHPEDLVPAEDEAPIEAYITEVASAPPPPPSFLPSLIRPLRTRAAMAQMRAAAPSTYHPLLLSGTPPLLPIPLPAPSTSRRADIPEADTPPRKRLLLTAPRPGCEVGESSAAARQPGPTMARRVDCSSVDTVETRVRDTERRMMAALEVANLRVSYQVDVHCRESSEFYTRTFTCPGGSSRFVITEMSIRERETYLRAREYGEPSGLG
ncbi:reverse transcriptase domain-containing protein [Tanacetum coccineum]